MAASLMCASADPGDNDLAFAQRGQIEGLINDVSANAEGDIFIVGSFTSLYRTPALHFAVLAPDGSLRFTLESDPTLGGLGDTFYSVAADANGGFYVGGPQGMAHLKKLGATLWQSDKEFQVQGSLGTGSTSTFAREVRSITIGPAGDLWAACEGSVSSGGLSKSFSIIHMNAGGTVDVGFESPNRFVSRVRYQSPTLQLGGIGTPYLLVAGAFGAGTMSTTGGHLQVVGSYLGCIAARGGNPVADCATESGRFVAGGLVEPNNRSVNYPLSFGMQLFSHDGLSVNTAFRTIPDPLNPDADQGAWIAAIEALDSGDLLIAGNFQKLGGSNVRNFAHLLPNGKLDTAFRNTSANVGGLLAMFKQPDGKFLLVGTTGGSPVRGTIERRLAMRSAAPAHVDQGPIDLTVYEGDNACFSANVSGYPAPALSWYRINGGVRTSLEGRITSALCLNNVEASDAGLYQIVAKGFCEEDSSRPARLTVLPVPPAPVNDQFADRITLSGLAATGIGSIRSATLEADEPKASDSFSGASVWWRWTAPSTGPVSVDLTGCEFLAGCAVYTGSTLSALSKRADNCQMKCTSNGEGGPTFCFCIGVKSQFTFNATAGTTYSIAVGGSAPAGSPGEIVLRINPIVLQPQSLHRNNDGSFSFTLRGPEGAEVIIQSTKSLNPADWKDLDIRVISGGQVSFSDPAAINNTRCYYRAVLK